MTNGNTQNSPPVPPAKTGCRLGVDYYYGFAYGTLLGLMHRDDVGDEAKDVIQGALERLDQFEFYRQRA